MADFSVRADHIDVEQIMRQIRARIRDKRGADYTEEEIRELAAVKLEKFLDPRAVRSDLLQHYRRQHQTTPLILPEEAHPPLYNFTPDTVYVSDRGIAGRILTIIRKILKPFSKLFFHVDTVWDVLSKQSVLNAQHTRLFQRAHQRFITRDELDSLNFEMFNNLVVELTRLGIEVKNLRMQVESFGTRLDFDERRARALEGVVQYRPGATVAKAPPPAPAGGDEDEEEAVGSAAGPGGEAGDALSRSARRRRRRRGRRRGAGGGMGPGEVGEGPGVDVGATSARDLRPNQGEHFGPDEPFEPDEQNGHDGHDDHIEAEQVGAGPVETEPVDAGQVGVEGVEPFEAAFSRAERSSAPPDHEPAAEPFYAEPSPSPSISSGSTVPEPEPPSTEPQRVFHRVFDRPRETEAPEAGSPEGAPRSDDHEPSQS